MLQVATHSLAVTEDVALYLVQVPSNGGIQGTFKFAAVTSRQVAEPALP